MISICSFDRESLVSEWQLLGYMRGAQQLDTFGEKRISYRRLKGAVKMGDERILISKFKYSLLEHCTLDVVVFQNNILFQSLDSIEFPTAFHLSQKHLQQESHPKNFNAVIMLNAEIQIITLKPISREEVA